MNKRGLFLTIMIITAFVMAACGNDSDEVTNPPANNDSTTEENTTDDGNTENGAEEGNTSTDTNENNTSSQESAYNFTSFDLEADFEGTNDAVDVDYDHENDGTEASYEDKIQGVQLAGDEAMEELDSIFTSFDFDENTPDDEVLNLVFEAFNIPEDAENVELDIDFNGTEKEYRQ